MIYNETTYENALNRVTTLLDSGEKFIMVNGKGGSGKSRILHDVSHIANTDHEFNYENAKINDLVFKTRNQPFVAAVLSLPESTFVCGNVVNLNFTM